MGDFDRNSVEVMSTLGCCKMEDFRLKLVVNVGVNGLINKEGFPVRLRYDFLDKKMLLCSFIIS